MQFAALLVCRLPFPALLSLAMVAFTTLLSGPAKAQTTGTEAFEAYVAALNRLGVEVSQDTIHYDKPSDTLKIDNMRMHLSGRFSSGNETSGPDTAGPAQGDGLSFALTAESPACAISGLVVRETEISAKRWDCSDDVAFSMSLSDGSYEFVSNQTISGLETTNYRAILPEAVSSESGRLLALTRFVFLASFDEQRIASLVDDWKFHAVRGDERTLEIHSIARTDGLLARGARNGVVEEESFEFSSETISDFTEYALRKEPEVLRWGKSIYKSVDYGVLIDFLDPSVPVSDTPRVFISSGSMSDYTANQQLDMATDARISYDKLRFTEFSLTNRDVDLLVLLKMFLNADADYDLGHAGLSFFNSLRSIGLAKTEIENLSLTLKNGPESPDAINVAIATLGLSGVNSNGIDEILLSGLNMDIDEQRGDELHKLMTASGAKLALQDIEFAAFDPMPAIFARIFEDPDYVEEQPFEVFSTLAPRSFAYDIEDFELISNHPGTIRIGKAALSVSTAAPPVPTSLQYTYRDISSPVASMSDSPAKQFLQALDIDNLTWSSELLLHWDEETSELRLDQLMLDLEHFGKVEINARLANVPKALFEDPRGQGQAAAILSRFVEATATFKDVGMTRRSIAHLAKQRGMAEEDIQRVFKEQILEAASKVNNEAFTQMVDEAVSKFLADPEQVTISLKPESPVPAAQILGSIVAPQSLPDLLNVNIVAN